MAVISHFSHAAGDVAVDKNHNGLLKFATPQNTSVATCQTEPGKCLFGIVLDAVFFIAVYCYLAHFLKKRMPSIDQSIGFVALYVPITFGCKVYGSSLDDVPGRAVFLGLGALLLEGLYKKE